jgi:hypothetical protein
MGVCAKARSPTAQQERPPGEGRPSLAKKAFREGSASQQRSHNAYVKMVKAQLTAQTGGDRAACPRPAPFKLDCKRLAIGNALRFDLYKARRFNAKRRAPIARARAAILHCCDLRIIGDDEARAAGPAMAQLKQYHRISDAE